MQIDTKFGLAADEYGSFRPGYPAAIFERAFGCATGRSLAVDLGAGTGLSAEPLLAKFARVVAVEPDAAMAAKLPARLEVRVARAEDVTFEPGTVDLVTAGNAFYWTDGPRVLENAARWLAPGGAVALWRYPYPQADSPGVQALLEEARTGPWAAHHHARLLDPEYTKRTARACPALRVVVDERVPNPVSLEPRALAGFFASTSYGAAWLRTRPDPRADVAAMIERIAKAHGKPGPITVDFGLELIVLKSV